MKRRKLHIVAVMIVGAMFVTLTGCSSANNGDAEGAMEENSAATLFAEMETTDLDGNKLDSSLFAENKLTLVNVWNVGCTPCIEEIPVLDKLNEEYKDRDVAIKGMYYNFGKEIDESERQAIDEILFKAGASYPHIVISKDMYASAEMQTLRAFPTTYFVDSSGKIIASAEGARDYDGWKYAIEEVLREKL